MAGSWQAHPWITVAATIGLVVATVYSLRIMQKVFFGVSLREYKLPDLSFREVMMFVPLIIVIIWLGVYPQPVINTAKPGATQNVAVHLPVK